MNNVTDEQCDARTGGLHAKLDLILANQADQRERLAIVETRVSGNGGFIRNIITVIIACITALCTKLIFGK